MLHTKLHERFYLPQLVKYAAAVSLCLLVALVSCTKPAPHVSHRAYFQVHADTRFTPAERESVIAAVRALDEQMVGLISIDVVFDAEFDFADEWPPGAIVIKRAYAQDAEIKACDKAHPQGCFGQCDGLAFTKNPAHISIVAERIAHKPQLMQCTVMHELLHAFGCQHDGEDVHNVIGDHVNVDTMPIVMTCADDKELCSKVGCNASLLPGCL